MFETTDQTVEIDILAFPETTVILLASVIEPLRAANRISGQRLYDWRLLSPDGRPVNTESEPLLDRSPIDTSLLLGRFSAADRSHVDAEYQRSQRNTGSFKTSGGHCTE